MQVTNPDEYLEKLGERIAQLRKDRGLSQRDLALKCGWDKTNYQKIERGKLNLTTKTLLKLCDALEIGMDELFRF